MQKGDLLLSYPCRTLITEMIRYPSSLPEISYVPYFFIFLPIILSYVAYSDAQPGIDLSSNVSKIHLDKIYENSEKNFNISYPSEWKQLSNGDNITLVSPLENKSDNFQERIIFTGESASNTELTTMGSLKILGYKENLDGFALSDFKKDVLAGSPAYKIVYSYRQANNSMTKLEIFSKIGTKTYSFNYVAEANKYKTYLPIIEEVLKRIVIHGFKAPANKSSKLTQLHISDDPAAMVANPASDKLYVTNRKSVV